jgi:hypothetical protein
MNASFIEREMRRKISAHCTSSGSYCRSISPGAYLMRDIVTEWLC